MRIAMIGTGYVGLVSGACFSDFGHDVICVDKDEQKIEALRRGVMPIFEPGLEDLVIRNREGGRLRFTSDVGAAIRDADVVFIASGTNFPDALAGAPVAGMVGSPVLLTPAGKPEVGET